MLELENTMYFTSTAKMSVHLPPHPQKYINSKNSIKKLYFFFSKIHYKDRKSVITHFECKCKRNVAIQEILNMKNTIFFF